LFSTQQYRIPSHSNRMVVRLRLQRFGKKHSPFYRMVAADSRAPRDGKFLEVVSSSSVCADCFCYTF
jgi:hypothetical protein